MSNLLEKCDFGPTTQSIDSGKTLAKFLGLGEELHEIIQLADGVRLTLSTKKDAYYVTTAKECSCKAGQYHRFCKHRKAIPADPRGHSSGKYVQVPEEVISDSVLRGYDGPAVV